MPKLNGGQALIQSLAALGADMVFGVPGWGQYEAVDALWQHPTVRYVSVRNELDSTFLADAYAQVSNKPAVALVVPGPGLLYAGAGLASAFANSSPVLVVTSANTHPVLNHRQLELTTLRTMTKWTGMAHAVADIPDLVAEAWCQLLTGRPRPVGLVVPHEVLAASDEVALPVSQPESARPVANGVDTAAARIVEARRPLLWVGSGIRWSGAEDILRTFAHRLRIPVTTTRRGKGLVDEAGPLGLGYPEMRYGPVKEWINQRDLVIAVGVGQDLSHLSVPVVQIDIDALQPERSAANTLFLHGDAKATLEALDVQTSGFADRSDAAAARDLETISHLKTERFEPDRQLEPQHSLMQAIRRGAPKEAVIIQGMTQMGYYSRNYLSVPAEGRYLTSSTQITLGAAYLYALGAKLAAPDRPVVAVSGDGGFLYGAHAMATAVQEGIHSVVLVFNDNAYGNVLRAQREEFDERVIGTRLHNPDFPAMARTFGARGLRADSPEQLEQLLREAVQTEAHTVIEIPVGEMERAY